VIIATPPKIGWRDQLRASTARIQTLSAQRSFVRSTSGWVGTRSERQLAWIDPIYANVPA
jgi:hypothetical protein